MKTTWKDRVADARNLAVEMGLVGRQMHAWNRIVDRHINKLRDLNARRGMVTDEPI